MKKFIFTIIIFCQHLYGNAQQVSMKIDEATENPDLIRLNRFEGIYSEKFTFTGSDLQDKNYQLICKEFKDGQLIDTSVIFDSTEDEYFKINSDSLVFYSYSKIENDRFKIQFQFNSFNKTKNYPIISSMKDDYVLKNFLGADNEMKIDMKEHYILVFMTPYVKDNGFKTYCEVAQSEVNPEKLGEKYNLPHYFLIEIKFL